MKPFIVASDGMDKEVFEALRAVGDFEVHPQAKVTPDELKALLPRINGLVIRSATTVNAELLAMAPNLKLVIRAGEGTDNIDKKLCQERGVKVANTPGANNNSAAEHAIAMMFTVLRKTAWAHESMKRGEWEKTAFTGLELSNKTVGIVGFGRIGQIVAKRLSGFEPKVLFYDPHHTNSPIPYAQSVDSLAELFRQSDVISVHVPLMPETRNLIGRELLDLMKPSSIVINCARGGIVVEEDLYNVLRAGKIRGAGLDVFEKEPLPEGSKLLELKNVSMTPHLGASTEEAQLRVGWMALDQLKRFFLQNELLNEVRAK